jgi:hypothetical protein
MFSNETLPYLERESFILYTRKAFCFDTGLSIPQKNVTEQTNCYYRVIYSSLFTHIIIPLPWHK